MDLYESRNNALLKRERNFTFWTDRERTEANSWNCYILEGGSERGKPGRDNLHCLIGQSGEILARATSLLSCQQLTRVCQDQFGAYCSRFLYIEETTKSTSSLNRSSCMDSLAPIFAEV
jgi:hypothetical protein